MKYLSMFSGVGGFEKGIEDAARSIKSNRQQQTNATLRKYGDSLSTKNVQSIQSEIRGNNFNWECIGCSEIDKYASAVYQYHYPEVKNYGDARAINPDGLPDIDLIVGGFPCQSFSIAGKRGGFEDTRGTLFFEIARIARAKRPGYLFLENVKGLLNHDEGNTFATIITTLDELGYDYQWQVLNSKYHGVPQNRERVFIIANLRDRCRPQIFPFGEANTESNEWDTREQVALALQSPGHSCGNYRGMNLLCELDNGQANRVYNPSGNSPTIPTPSGGNHIPKIAVPVLTPNRSEKRQNGRRFKEDGEPMFTLTGQDIHDVAVFPTVDANYYKGINCGSNTQATKRALSLSTGIRRLTPIECERLQGFPDNWTKYGMFEERPTRKDLLLREKNPELWAYNTRIYGENVVLREISDTQRYRCMGNAVTTKVIRDIVLKWNEN